MGAFSLPSIVRPRERSREARARRASTGAVLDAVLDAGGARALLSASVLAATSALVGCASPTTDAPDAEATAQAATAVVVVERTTGPGDAVRGDDVIARVLRARHGAVDDQVLRMTGVTIDVPSPGSCALTIDPGAASRANESVELLDVGSVSVGGRDATILLPHAMPDPTGLVSGVVYSAHAAEAFAAGGIVDFHASGGPDLPSGFSATVNTPMDLGDVRVVRNAAGLEIAWEAADDGDRDVVYAEVVAPSSNVVARCATVDSGRMTIAANTFDGLEEGTVVLHRLHREAARTREIPLVEVRFDLARVVTFRR